MNMKNIICGKHHRRCGEASSQVGKYRKTERETRQVGRLKMREAERKR